MSPTKPHSPVEALLAVAAIGGRLGIAGGDKLRMLLPPDAPPELKEAIREHRDALTTLLGLNFLVVRSDALNATIFWTPDDASKETLVSAGAAPGTVYTAAELAQLINKRVTVGELPAIHAARGAFNGRITEP